MSASLVDRSSHSGARAWRVFFDAAASAGPGAPLVLCLDGDDQFATTVAAYRRAREAGAVRPLTLVGIGYGAGYRQPKNQRGLDYTPVPSADEPRSGGGPAFLAWLADELLPWLRADHGLGAAGCAITGHSLGALFAVYAFFDDRRLFECCLASAPSLWYENRAILGAIAERRRTSAAWPGRLVLSVGGLDSASMREDLGLLERQLADAPFEGLRVFSQRFPHRDHFTVVGEAMRDGLCALYPAR